MINEAINGKSNPTLKEDFSSFIQKVSDFPQEMLFPSEKKEFEWSE
jgi:hypothetical protein